MAIKQDWLVLNCVWWLWWLWLVESDEFCSVYFCLLSTVLSVGLLPGTSEVCLEIKGVLYSLQEVNEIIIGYLGEQFVSVTKLYMF